MRDDILVILSGSVGAGIKTLADYLLKKKSDDIQYFKESLESQQKIIETYESKFDGLHTEIKATNAHIKSLELHYEEKLSELKEMMRTKNYQISLLLKTIKILVADIDNISAPMFIAAPDGTIQHSNPKYSELFSGESLLSNIDFGDDDVVIENRPIFKDNSSWLFMYVKLKEYENTIGIVGIGFRASTLL